MHTLILCTLVVLLVVFVVLSALIFKNNLTRSIQIKWVDEVYQNKLYGDNTLNYSDIPSYNSTLYNPLVWKHTPLKDFIKK